MIIVSFVIDESKPITPQVEWFLDTYKSSRIKKVIMSKRTLDLPSKENLFVSLDPEFSLPYIRECLSNIVGVSYFNVCFPVIYSFNNAKDFLDSPYSSIIPYKNVYHDDATILNMIENLDMVKFDDRVQVNEHYFIRNTDFVKQELLFRAFGKPVLLLHKDEDYFNFNTLSDMWQEENRLKCKLFWSRMSPEEYYKRSIKYIANTCIRERKVITPYNIRETLFEQSKKSKAGECTSFRPLNMIYIMELFNVKSVLDFSSGWGDRLIACLTKGVKYTGVDPNRLLHPKYQQMIDFFVKYRDVNPNNYTMIESRIQDAVLPDEKVELVFTSPPYFNFEMYTTGGEVTENTEEEWFNSFLAPAIEISSSKLLNHGHLVLVINQKEGETYLRRMIKYVNDNIPSLHYLGVISYSRKNPQPMWIWQKLETIPETLYNPPIILTTHKSNSVNFRVFRDDFLVGGTKQRALVPYILETNKEEYVYAGPVEGYAQVALAYASQLARKKSTIFVSKKREKTTLTKYAETFGAKVVEINGGLKQLQEEAKKYTDEEPGRAMLAFGGNDETYVRHLEKSIRKALPKVRPRRIWVAVGSAVILNVLYKIFPPPTKFVAVQVGKQVWPDQMEGKPGGEKPISGSVHGRTTLYISDERFGDVAKEQPPYHTVSTYDAKLWTFFLKHGRNGDYIWNVGKDILPENMSKKPAFRRRR